MPKKSTPSLPAVAQPISQDKIPPVPVEQLEIDQSLRAIDRMWAAQRGRFSGGLSPTAQTLAVADWWLHLVAALGGRAGQAAGAGHQGRAQGRASVVGTYEDGCRCGAGARH